MSPADPSVLVAPNTPPSTPSRWSLTTDRGIVWEVGRDTALPHLDRLEMSGQEVAVAIRYGADARGSLVLREEVIWPRLRLVPNDTYGSLARFFDQTLRPKFLVAGQPVENEKLVRVEFDGRLRLETELPGGLVVVRSVFPSPTLPALLERYLVRNGTKAAVSFEVRFPAFGEDTDPAAGVDGAYRLEALAEGAGEFVLEPGAAREFTLAVTGRPAGEKSVEVSGLQEEEGRWRFVGAMRDNLQLETPDAALDRMFLLSKVRATESIFRTRGGLMHSPGSGMLEGTTSGKGKYYAAIWANDQVEYAGPLFAYLGNETGSEATLNACRHFARFMNAEYRPIPSSIVAEGKSYWNGAGDRGDAAMLAYGAGRFALARGDRALALELWPLIEWCLEYCHRRTNAEGVVASDTDELENRLPSGDANLHTSVLTYDALLSAAYLSKALDRAPGEAEEYATRAAHLREAIESFFGAQLEGFHTYRYYRGNTDLRAWICSPLTAGIMERKAGTIAALLSPRLWTADGLATASGRQDFWDRSTLYALRGMFQAGEADEGWKALEAYTKRRLLGEHVPYAVEAYPEGGQSHLAGESALYVRLCVEGIFGVRPTGMRSFTWQPALPTAWPGMALRRMHAFGEILDLEVRRVNGNLELTVRRQDHPAFTRVVVPGGSVEVDLSRL